MFTGIVADKRRVSEVHKDATVHRLSIEFNDDLLEGLELGASVSVDGVCLTVTKIEKMLVHFDVVPGTLTHTTLGSAEAGDFVNIERSMTAATEVGGHEVSGHVDAPGEVLAVEDLGDTVSMTFQVPEKLRIYLFSKGFVSVNGVSLTLCDVDQDAGTFMVWLIPETLRRTNLGNLTTGNMVNLEIHKGTQVLVDSVRSAVNDFLTKALSGDKNMEALGSAIAELPGMKKPTKAA